MAQTRKASGEQRKAFAGKVHVFCNACDSEIAVCKNEWHQLTGSYVQPKERVKLDGAKIGSETVSIPSGAGHEFAGCGVAALLCANCDVVIGRYCRNAPERRREALVDQYFYKLSKTYLKVRATAKQKVEHVILNEYTARTPKPHSKVPVPASSSSPMPRRVSELAAKSSPLNNSAHDSEEQEDVERHSPPPITTRDDQGGLMNRLLELERIVRAGSIVTPMVQAKIESTPAAEVPQLAQGGYASETRAHNDQLYEDQKRQIESMSAQLNNLRGTIDDLRGVIQDLRAEKSRQESLSLRESAVMNHFDEMIRSVKNGQTSNSEADSLRAENLRLKDRLSTIAGAMGVPADEPATHGQPPPFNEHEPGNSLGKRKREEGTQSRAGYRPNDSFRHPDYHTVPHGSDYRHPLTPESTQDIPSARGPTPVQRSMLPDQTFLQPNMPYVPPHMRHQYSEPNLRQYGPAGYNSAFQQPYPPQQGFIPGHESQYQVQMIPRTDSRASMRPPPGQGDAYREGQQGHRDYRGSADHPVEFSDDEIATANASDAPLSVPKPRAPPPHPMGIQPVNNAAYSLPRGMSEAWPPYEDQTPAARAKHVPRSLTCTSLRQPATGYGLNHALHFTPDLVKQRIPKRSDGTGRKTAKEKKFIAMTGSEKVHRSHVERAGTTVPSGQPDQIPIDPNLEDVDDLQDPDPEEDSSQQSKRNQARVNEAEDEERDGLYKPGRTSVRKTPRRPATRKAVVARRDELALD